MIRHTGIALGVTALALTALAQADDKLWLPTGVSVSPLAAPDAAFQALTVDLPQVGKKNLGGGTTTLLSPDGMTLFVLTTGFNGWLDDKGKPILAASTEHLLIYDVSSGALALKQDVPVPNAFGGMSLSAGGKSLAIAGGDDDNLHFYKSDEKGTWAENGDPLAFGHKAGNALIKSAMLLKPMAAGTALTADGRTLVVANYENDSIEVVDLVARKANELDLRPGKIDPANKSVAGGEFPYWVAIKGNDTAYVSSARDREIVVVGLAPSPHVTARIPVAGNPNRMILDHTQTHLYVAADNSDRVHIIDTATNKVTASIAVGVPPGYGANTSLPGAAPNSLAFSPDEKMLYVTEGGINAVGVVDMSGGAPVLSGLIPTAWQPNSVSVSNDGKTLYVANGKSPAAPNPTNCRKARPHGACDADKQAHSGNQYILQQVTGGIEAIPVPDADTLKRLTAQVADNNRYREVMSKADEETMAALRKRIKHVIYIVKENRTYDQVLGDLKGTDGDPSLVQFGPDVTANEHAIASQFVALDSFFDSGEVSGDGWQWSTAARAMDITEKGVPVNYADRGLTYDTEGSTRAINVAVPIEQRTKVNPVNDADPDLLPGPANESAADGPEGEAEQGYIWNAALRAHKTIRNYGFFVDIVRYDTRVPVKDRIPVERHAYLKHLVVSTATSKDLADLTDPYFRGFDNQLPDLYRYREWEREFSGYEKKGDMPSLEFVRFMHDHTGDYATALDGVNTPDTQVADNDYAVGLLLERVAHSKFANSTLVFVVEDDAQDGPDHVDAHRSVAFVAGPYVKQHAVVSDRYTTVNVIRTMEDVLGLKALNLHDGNARPMASVFDLKNAKWDYRAAVPSLLRTTQLPLPPLKKAEAAPRQPLHNAAWWADATKGFDFSAEDRLPSSYNQILWRGMMGEKPYPAARDGKNRRMRS
jgi:YVTN family beta-propeller protein